MKTDTQELTHWALEPMATPEEFESAYTLTLEPVLTRRTRHIVVFGNVSLALGTLPRRADRITVRPAKPAAALTITFS